ncbi:MAG: hypothetical protein Q4B29_00795 [Candidatus Saccharibacteria bacterium]|nr:hypothetical protein [Candidatus Saccharibacteria bacterium]
MGKNIFTHYSYAAETKKREISFEHSSSGEVRASKTVAEKARQQATETNKLDPSVDPAVQAIHRSLIRFEPHGEKFRVTVGCPMNIESVCDVTGSMGENVQIMFGVLPETYDLIAKALPGYDPQLSLGVFGDVVDDYVLMRPQFEMTAEKIVEYCSHLFQSGTGGDSPEDPQYAMYGAAYLTNAYVNRIGLKGYHFLITDAPMHGTLSLSTLKRVFGHNVLELVAENNHQDAAEVAAIDPAIKGLCNAALEGLTGREIRDLEMGQLHQDLSKIYHAFLIMVGDQSYDCWKELYDKNHTIHIGSTRYLPQVQAAIIGLTEATIEPCDIEQFLVNSQVPKNQAQELTRQLLKVPYGEQRRLEETSGLKIPKKGDLFASKQDLQPCGFIDDDVANKVEDVPSGTWL